MRFVKFEAGGLSRGLGIWGGCVQFCKHVILADCLSAYENKEEGGRVPAIARRAR